MMSTLNGSEERSCSAEVKEWRCRFDRRLLLMITHLQTSQGKSCPPPTLPKPSFSRPISQRIFFRKFSDPLSRSPRFLALGPVPQHISLLPLNGIVKPVDCVRETVANSLTMMSHRFTRSMLSQSQPSHTYSHIQSIKDCHHHFQNIWSPIKPSNNLQPFEPAPCSHEALENCL